MKVNLEEQIRKKNWEQIHDYPSPPGHPKSLGSGFSPSLSPPTLFCYDFLYELLN
jgi:hypothetical protein